MITCSLEISFNGARCQSKKIGHLGFCPAARLFQYADSKPNVFPVLNCEYMGNRWFASYMKGSTYWKASSPTRFCINAEASICFSKAQRLGEKTINPNMFDIYSARGLVDSLLGAGDKLVILDFYSPGCGGCKAMHPKICELAGENPNALFLKVNYQELKTLCCGLHIHVLPFFRFYRGAKGRLCSFSCTNATINKFKDALAKYGGDGYNRSGPSKGLDESELVKLASAGEIPLDYLPKDIIEFL